MREDPAETMLEGENEEKQEDLEVINLVLTVAMKRIAKMAREGGHFDSYTNKEYSLEQIGNLADAMILLGSNLDS